MGLSGLRIEDLCITRQTKGLAQPHFVLHGASTALSERGRVCDLNLISVRQIRFGHLAREWKEAQASVNPTGQENLAMGIFKMDGLLIKSSLWGP